MFKGAQQLFIQASPQKVYEIATTYPTFVSFFRVGSRIISQNDINMEVEVHALWLGFYNAIWRGVGEKHPFSRIDFTQTQGLFQGLKAIWSFESSSNGTLVSILTIFSKPGWTSFGEFLSGKFLVEKTTKKILLELKKTAEFNSRVL